MGSDGKLRDLRAAPLSRLLLAGKPPPRRAVQVAAKAIAPVQPRPPVIRLLRMLDSLAMRAGRRVAARWFGRTFEVAVYCAIAAAIGLPSAWVMIEGGSRLTRQSDGVWQRWTKAGASDADPYTAAHFVWAGWLPMNGAQARYFTASRDSTGEPLYADCDYTLSGKEPAARRWTLNAYDLQGLLLDRGAGPASLSSVTSLPGPAGTVSIKVSQATTSGNWLSVAGASRMQLMLTIYGRPKAAVTTGAGQAEPLFRIDKGVCR